MSDARLLAALSELDGMNAGAASGVAEREAKLNREAMTKVTIVCAGCRKGHWTEVAHVYRTPQGLLLVADWVGLPTAEGGTTRRDEDFWSGRASHADRPAPRVVHFLDDPLPPDGEQRWLAHCRRCGWNRLPPLDTLRDATRGRSNRVSLRCKPRAAT